MGTQPHADLEAKAAEDVKDSGKEGSATAGAAAAHGVGSWVEGKEHRLFRPHLLRPGVFPGISRDTREQKPYDWRGFPVVTEHRPTGYGDYGVLHADAPDVVDRKQLGDFAHWLVNAKSRRLQIDTAAARNVTLHIVVECSLSEFQRDEYVVRHRDNILRILSGKRMGLVHVCFAGSWENGQSVTEGILRASWAKTNL